MILENIKVGITYKNYKSLCEILNEPIKTGKSKQLQLEDWNRYFNYNKNGNKFVITEIFDTPKQKVTTHSTKCKKSVDNRSNNGGNNTSIISDYMRNWIEIALESDGSIDGSASKIIRDMNLVIDDFSNAYYNFDDCFTDCTSIEKQFFLDYCDVVMNSYKQRLKRIISNLVEYGDFLYKEYYKVSFIKESKDGEFYATDDIEDLETIDKIDKIKNQLEVSYGVTENSKKWKLYCDRKKSKQFYNDFIQQVRKLLKRDEITNCYKSMYMFSYDYHADVDKNFDNQKFWNAQKKFAEDKIQTVFNKKVSHYFKEINGKPINDFVKVDKYRVNSVRPYVVALCQNMINCGGVERTEQINMPEEKPFDESMLTNAQQQQVELGLKTLDDFKPYYD